MKKKFLLSFLISFICFSLIFIGLGEDFFLKKNTIAIDGNPVEDTDLVEGNKVEQK